MPMSFFFKEFYPETKNVSYYLKICQFKGAFFIIHKRFSNVVNLKDPQVISAQTNTRIGRLHLVQKYAQ